MSPSSPVATQVLVREIAAAHRTERGALLPILHDIQEALGHVPPQAIGVLADVLNLSRADVHGVVSFYHDFRGAPAGRTHVRVCRAEACQAVGAAELVALLAQRYGIGMGDTSPDGALTADQVFCLGNCALGPSVEIDGTLHGRVDAERLTALLGAAVAP
ncbi:NAD(P)H-dependent oxidoreductase subunit E [Nocardia crassostreae]|uniref:NAD(P)H-dependent oxidoreductase subunit E n=1 Tax=Nocardia crassostreae TaxID=53428 RepID=UPI000AF9B72B|nr:NAD(P)H-dependent oxidoreductase subunit E [Nocardia crassostreae]